MSTKGNILSLTMKYYLFVMRRLLIPLLAILFFSCNGNKQNTQNLSAAVADSTYNVKYALGFKADIYDDYKLVTVRDPADTTHVLQKYVLVDKQSELPINLPDGIVIRTPLESVVTYSTIHAATLQEIGQIQTIKGVCEPQYIDIDYIKEGVTNGTIANLGQAANPIVEKIVDLDPEAIWATPIEGYTYGVVTKTNIPIIETPDYLETNPLGRAEWIRFYSLFYNNEAHVDSLFDQTEKNYNKIKNQLASVNHRPTVFLDLMYGNVWHTSGGKSFIANMLSDAGASYVWSNVDSKIKATPLSFEEVLEKTGDAEFWLIKYHSPNDLTYTTLADEYKPYSYFDAYKKRNIYQCNTTVKAYYEDLPIHPDYILNDFAYIFHPEAFPNYTLRYYSRMKE